MSQLHLVYHLCILKDDEQEEDSEDEADVDEFLNGKIKDRGCSH